MKVMKALRQLKWFNSINWKFTMIYVLLILVAMQVFSAYFMNSLESHYVNNFTRMLDQQASLFAYSAQNYFDESQDEETGTLQREDMDVFIDRFFSTPLIDIQVLDQNGVVIGASTDRQRIIGQINTQLEVKRALAGTRDETIRINPENGHRTKIISLPITLGNQVVGAIYLMASMEDTYQTIQDINGILVTGTLIALVLTVSLGVTLAKTITSPIKDMTVQASSMADGDFSKKVKIYGQDEIGQLAQVFNEMSERLSKALHDNAQERNRIASILSHMSDGVVAIDHRGSIMLSNATAEALLGKTEEEMVGEPIADVLELPDQEWLKIYEVQDYRFLVDVAVNEQPIILQVKSTQINWEGGTQGAIIVLQDVTQQEKLEGERKEFVANVSHELRTPLTTMKSYLEALDDGVLQDKDLAPRFIHVVQNETERMIRLVNDLLQLSSMDTKKIPLKWKTTNMHLLIKDVVERFSIPFANRELEVKLDLADDLPLVLVDPDQMVQVMDNIMSNSIKYSNQGGVISVEASLKESDIEIVISDNGIGIPKPDLKHIFKRFYRVDKARSREMGGTGLGLAIAKEIIEAHDGSIRLDSVVGEGTKVFIRLPIIRENRGDEV
ncbi:cell wall metabolism sensor histidine kinase WalK [Bacillus horti]|uniref:histidine kinase n=1 Tax=Caldalkalibacillus horti TaxID=77523 RepID=A0ABT9W1Q1_9BACI|nr:cell wall metabolism sensor histidine kinase WalK [Bacillus horti]MDQ0167141.1 two-component system sensor histidine kinase VicK [Bacillus horti]